MTNTQSIINIKTIDDLKINGVYTNDIIAKVFRCSKQGGMRKSNTTKTSFSYQNKQVNLFTTIHG